MRKIMSVILTALLLAGILSGCKTSSAPRQDKNLRIVTTIFPVYDWVYQILGEQAENAEITLLMDSGVDLHNFQPTVDDMVRISTCDLFVYVGGESDAWVTDALATATNQDMAVINLMEVLGEAVKEEEIIEGMEHDHGHEEESYEEESEHHHEMDEHIWLSLNNARVICTQIAQQLGILDSANADVYIENAEKYCAALKELDASLPNGSPLMAVITSPTCRPACAAGELSSTDCTKIPAGRSDSEASSDTSNTLTPIYGLDEYPFSTMLSTISRMELTGIAKPILSIDTSFPE